MNIPARNVGYLAACAAHANRWLTSNNPGDYQSAVDASAVFGDEIGNAISLDEHDPFFAFKLGLLIQLCEFVLRNGFVTSTNPADYASTIQAITTYYNLIITGFV